MQIAQLTDLHIKAGRRKAYGIVDTAAMLERAVAHLVALRPRPDALLLTGDLVDHGTAADYALLRELLTPALQAFGQHVFLLAGNHDEGIALRAAFPEFTYWSKESAFSHYAVEISSSPKLRLIALDTVVPMQSHGELCDARLAWLRSKLEEDRSPTLIAMHHPPFATGIAHMDKIGLRHPKSLETLLCEYGHVKRIVCGHLHRAIETSFVGVLTSTCPSTAHQVALDLDPASRDDFVFEPPGYQLHTWDGVRFVSHTVLVGEFGQRYPFRDGGALID